MRGPSRPARRPALCDAGIGLATPQIGVDAKADAVIGGVPAIVLVVAAPL
jgi:hypothetical protein